MRGTFSSEVIIRMTAMALSVREFLALVKNERHQPQRLCACGCGQPLEPRFWGERLTINGKEVNEDCYFDDLGKEIDDYPII